MTRVEPGSPVNAVPRFWQTAPWHLAAMLAVLGLVAWLSPPPFPTDQLMMEHVGQGVIIPGCSDLNCFRMLVPATVELFPGPSLPRWRAYAVVANAAAALATGRLALALGLTPRAATLAMWLSALGAGSFSTINHPYNADPLVLFFAPVTTLFLLSGRTAAAGVLASVGIFAKEFAAAPLFIAAGAAALCREWRAFRRGLLLALGVTGLWVCLQMALMVVFQYSYNQNPSSRPLEGGYLLLWIRSMTPATALFALFGTYGALYLMMPSGLWLAPERLRHLAIAAVPAALAFAYVATPERALWNFYFLAIPLAALVLGHLPAPLAWAFVACYGLANLRIGAQVTGIPSSRYALVLSVMIAAAAVLRASRTPLLKQPGLERPYAL